jgi:propanol-preferring alcohol dehydrogenase
MKAAVVEQLREPLVVREMPDPAIGPADAVLRVEACGICRSDRHIWQGDWTWVGISMPPPFVMGHEFAGIVEAVGPEVRRVRVGDRVVVPFHQGCGRCPYCLDGRPNLCDAQVGFMGGFGRLTRVGEADFNMIPLPEAVDFVTGAAIGCRYMTSWHAVADRAGVRGGEWVAVHGCGGIGLSAVQIAAALGAQVVAVDVDDVKLEKATKEGAVATVNAKRERASDAVKTITGGGAHVSIDGLGIADTVLNSVMSLRKGGRHVQIGLTTRQEQGMVSLPVDLMVVTEATFMGSVGNPNPHYAPLLQMIAHGQLRPQSLVERTVPIEETGGVLKSMSDFGTLGFTVIDRW